MLDADNLANTVDIGPYQTNATHYRIPGAILDSATVPVPPLGSTNAMPDLDLMWLPSRLAQSQSVYLRDSTCGEAMTQICSHGDSDSGNICTPPSQLKPGHAYEWRVDTTTAPVGVRS